MAFSTERPHATLPTTPPRRPAAGRGLRAAAAFVVAALLATPTGAGRPCPATGQADAGGSPARALGFFAFSSPDLRLTLPPRLAEVSGVAALTATEVVCVQDEQGRLFVYDLAARRITREVPFGAPGDYEDVCLVGSRLFVLRSDGLLYEIHGLVAEPAVRIYDLRLPTADNEGLCYDARHNRLLVASKSRLGKGQALKDARALFGFDLDRGAPGREPVLVVSADDVRAFAARQDQVPANAGGKGRKSRASWRFMPSAVAIHPQTSEVFVLSGVDGALASFDQVGTVTGFVALDPRLFPQAEGMTFLPGGELVITNEAAGRQPTLLLFKPKPAASRSPKE